MLDAKLLNAEQIRKINEKRRSALKKTYIYMLHEIMSRIQKAAEYGKLRTMYQIPGMIVGFPLYNRNKAALYIQRQLSILGYTVNVEDTEVSVSWVSKNKRP